MITVNYCQFTQQSSDVPLVFFTTPVEVSLYRMKQKLLWNLTNPISDALNCYFITLTVDEQHYDEVFRSQSGSACMRQFLTLNRNWFKRGCSYRPSYRFEPVWRLERGKRNTQRLHFHLIFKTDAPLDVVRERFMDTWDYCQWDTQNIDQQFQELSDQNLSLFYACKYSSKAVKKYKKSGEMDDESESPAKTRQEMNTRIWSSSHYWKRPKRSHFMYYNPDLKLWERKLKKNWKLFDLTDKKWWSDRFKRLDESDEEFANRFYPLSPKLLACKGFDYYQGRVWWNYDPYLKKFIGTKKDIAKKEELNDWIADLETNDANVVAICELPESELPKLKKKLNFISQYFLYDKPLKLNKNKVLKDIDETHLGCRSARLLMAIAEEERDKQIEREEEWQDEVSAWYWRQLDADKRQQEFIEKNPSWKDAPIHFCG